MISKAIRRVTQGPSHVLIEVFEIDTAGRHHRYYFESIWKTDPATHKNGVRGPIPLEKLVEWVTAGSPACSLVEIPETGYLPLTQKEAAAAVQLLRDATHTIHYAPQQLLRNFISKTGLRIGLGAGSEKRWTCCETPLRCRVLPPRLWDLVGAGDVLWDELWPGGTSRYSLMEAAQRIVRTYGTISP
jgi:hypothetical protein